MLNGFHVELTLKLLSSTDDEDTFEARKAKKKLIKKPMCMMDVCCEI
jgi:hypothetical protein